MEQLRLGWLLKPLAVILLALVLFGMGYWLGLRSARVQVVAGTGPLRWVQFDPQQQLQPAPDPRELIPLQPGPGEGQPEECPLLIYQDGQLFRFELPKPVPGPGGPQPGPGIPEGSPELIPLDPSVPLLPAPPDNRPPQST
jgi:hypothetical protein